MRLLFALFLFAYSALAQAPPLFQPDPNTGILPIMEGWHAEAAPPALKWWPWSVAAFDYDGDADQDLLISQHSGMGGKILKNLLVENGTVTFMDVTADVISDGKLLPLGDGHEPVIWDFDNDGRLDIAGQSDGVQAPSFFNRPTGFVPLASKFTSVHGFMEIKDQNGDEYKDPWGLAHGPSSVKTERIDFLYDPATRNFVKQTPTLYVKPPYFPDEWQALLSQLMLDADGNGFMDSPKNRYMAWKWLTQHDLNGDGLLDCVFAGHAGYGGDILGRYGLRQPNGSCAESTEALGLPLVGYPVLIRDLNGDGTLEVLIAKGGTASGLYVNQAGHYAKVPNQLPTLAINDSYLTYVFVEDFDHDGLLDLIINCPRFGNTVVYRQSATNLFTSVLSFTSWDANGIAVADFDNNGTPDIATGIKVSSSIPPKEVRIYLNTTTPPEPPAPDPLLITTPTPLPSPNFITPLDANGGVGPYEWRVKSGALPPGVILTPEGVLSNGGETCHYAVEVEVEDTNGVMASKDLQIEGPCIPIAENNLIFLEGDALAQLKAKVKSGDPSWLAVKAQADGFLPKRAAPYHLTNRPPNSIYYSYQGGGWQDALQALSLAYLVTGNQAYAVKAGEVLDVISATAIGGNLQPITADRGYPTRSVPMAVAYALSWAGDGLSQEQKVASVAAINVWFDWFKGASSTAAYQRDGPAYSNYYGGHLLGFAAAARASADINPRAEEILAYLRVKFDAVTPESFETGVHAGGYFPESGSYGIAQFGYLLRYMQLAKDARLTAYAQKMARGLIYNLKPNRWQVTDEGNYAGDYTGVLPGFYPMMLAEALEGTTEGAWMQWMYLNLGTPPGTAGRVQTPIPFLRLLYEDNSRPSLDYRLTEPLAYCSPGDGHLFTRSDWTDNAVWASFAAGASVSANHESRKAGHVAIQKGNDYLLVNAGQWKGLTGISGSPTVFDLAGWRTNTLFFDDRGEYLYVASAFIGGQETYGANNFTCEVGAGYAYAEADLTSAYDIRLDRRNESKRTLRSFNRSFRAEGNLFTVQDRVVSLKPDHTKRLLWHFNNAGSPVVTGNTIKSTVGASAITLTVVSPASPLIRVASDGVSSFADSTSLTKRAEVSDSVPGTVLDALHVIVVE